MGRHRLAVRGPRPRPEHDERDPGPRPRRDPGRPGGRRGHAPGTSRAGSCAPPSPTTPATSRSARCPSGPTKCTPTLDRFRPLVRPGIRLVVGEPVVLNLTLVLGGAEDEITVTQEVSAVRTRSGELSYLVSAETIRDLPLNGRNYTDLAFLQPGVIAFPYRDGGSVVAHGLAVSVNGQDPRSNVYLLDGTLHERLHERPGGQRGRHDPRHRDGARVPRRGERLRRRVRPELRRPDQRHHQVRHQRLPRQRLRVPPQRRARRPQLLRPRGEAGLPPQPVRRHARRPDAPRPDVLLRGLRGAAREPRPHDLDRACPTRRRAAASCPRPGEAPWSCRSARACGPTSTSSRCRTARSLGGGLAAYRFPFTRRSTRTSSRAGSTRTWAGTTSCSSATRYDRAEQYLPTDFPQFPRTFVSRNQFVTAEYRQVFSARDPADLPRSATRARGSARRSRPTRPSRSPPFVPGRESLGAIDIGGVPRFGPQVSADVSIRQDVFAFNGDFLHTRGRHSLKAGALVERYQSDEYNPTFSLGIYTFAEPRGRSCAAARSASSASPPRATSSARGRYTLLRRSTCRTRCSLAERLTLNAGLRYEYATLPRDEEGRDVNMPDLLAPEPTVGPLYENPTGKNVSPRARLRLGRVRATGAPRCAAATGSTSTPTSHQNLIVTVTNPPATPRPVIAEPHLPGARLLAARSLSPSGRSSTTSRLPRVHVWNVNLQRELPGRVVATLGYAGSRGRQPVAQRRRRTCPIPETARRRHRSSTPRPRPGRTGLLRDRAQDRATASSWYDALIVELRRASAAGSAFQSSYTFSRNIDTTQASTFFSDATNGTMSAFPESAARLQQGPRRLPRQAQLGLQPDLGPAARPRERGARPGAARRLAARRDRPGEERPTADALRPDATARARGGRRRSAPGRASTARASPPAARRRAPSTARPSSGSTRPPSCCSRRAPTGTWAAAPSSGPASRSSTSRSSSACRWARLGPAGRASSCASRPSTSSTTRTSASPACRPSRARTDGEAPLPTLGRIRATATSSRQIQLGVRVRF